MKPIALLAGALVLAICAVIALFLWRSREDHRFAPHTTPHGDTCIIDTTTTMRNEVVPPHVEKFQRVGDNLIIGYIRSRTAIDGVASREGNFIFDSRSMSLRTSVSDAEIERVRRQRDPG